jgi:threonine synthase
MSRDAPIIAIRCVRCGHTAPLDGFPYRCPVCGGILLIELDLSAWSGVDPSVPGMERYRELLPVDAGSRLTSLGEGGTPLILAERLAQGLGDVEVLLKNETVNPTGSFKDRALAVMTTRVRDEGYRRVISSSSGNAGVSSAAYAARAGIEATVVAPENTRQTKLAQLTVHGARVVLVRGSTSDTYKLAKAAAETGEWANVTTTFLSPLATAAFKTIGYELADQLDGRTPDWVIAPVSAGPILVAVASAFREYHAAGRADGVPRMVCAQAAGCAPIVRAFEEGAHSVAPWLDPPATIATAIADPLLGYEDDGTLTLRVVRDTGGFALTVTDDAIREAIRRLAFLEGVFAEPAGAVPVAALRALRTRGVIGDGSRVVLLITGHGLKDPLAADQYVEAPAIDPDVEQLFAALAGDARTRQEEKAWVDSPDTTRS